MAGSWRENIGLVVWGLNRRTLEEDSEDNQEAMGKSNQESTESQGRRWRQTNRWSGGNGQHCHRKLK